MAQMTSHLITPRENIVIYRPYMEWYEVLALLV